MSKIAKQKALEVYPYLDREEYSYDEFIEESIQHGYCRAAYKMGYEQAEKDTIERVCEWLSRHYDIDLAYFRKAMEDGNERD